MTLAFTDDDDTIGCQAERALDGQEDACFGRAEITVKDVAVIGVDDQRNSAYAGREPADGTGLGHVRVDDIWPQLAHELDHSCQ